MTPDTVPTVTASSSKVTPLTHRTLSWSVGLFLLALVLGIFQPEALLQGANTVGFAICHQIPERSFSLHGHAMPLCARCTGTFLGALLGFCALALRRRTRCSDLPPTSVLAFLAFFFVAWGADGVNSYLTLLGAPHLYEPNNILRVTTGMLNGLMLSSLAYQVFSVTIWEETYSQRSIDSLAELGVMVLVGAALVLLILWGWSPLLYLLALLSVTGVASLLLLVNTLIATVMLRRENRAKRWRNLWLPALLGLIAMGVEIGAVAGLRLYLTRRFGFPF